MHEPINDATKRTAMCKKSTILTIFTVTIFLMTSSFPNALGGGDRRNAAAQAAKTTVTVTDFPGVDPTGAADSTNGILEAMAGSGRRKIIFPAGTYLISRTITLRSGTEVQGSGDLTVIKMSNSMAANPILPNVYGANRSIRSLFSNENTFGNEDISIRDLTIDSATRLPATNIPVIDIFFYNVTRVIVEHVKFLGHPGNNGDATAFLNSSHYILRNNRAYKMGNACYDQWNGVHDFLIERNTCDGGGWGAMGILVNGLTSGATNAFKPDTAYNGIISNNAVSRVRVYGIVVEGLCRKSAFDDGACGYVKNFTINNNSIKGVSDSQHPIRVKEIHHAGILVNGIGMTVSNNKLTNIIQNGIWVGVAYNRRQRGTTLNPQTKNVIVAHNEVINVNAGETNSRYGGAIHVTAAADHPKLTGNTVSGNHHTFAVVIDEGVTGAFIEPGAMSHGTMGLISDFGTNTKYGN